MGTETALPYVCIKCIKYHVKKNNPLMGTETLVETHFGGREDLKLN